MSYPYQKERDKDKECMEAATDLAVLKNVVSRIDTSIAAMSEVAANIGKLLAVHEERLNKLEKDSSEVTYDIRDLHSRISTMSRDILTKLEQTERQLEEKIRESNKETVGKINAVNKELNHIDERVAFIEKWKWMILGGAVAIGWALSRVPGLNLL